MREFNAMRCTFQQKHTPHPELKGVYHSDGCKIATDAHILVIIKSEYSSELEGKIVDKDGNIINARFPQYSRAIPEMKKCKRYSIDLTKFKDAIDKGKKAYKEISPVVCITIAENVKISLKYAQLVLSFIKTYKITELHFNKTKQTTSLLFTSDGNMMVCMGITTSIDGEAIINDIITKKI